MIDVVYLVRPGDSNEELRYSLRSLERHVSFRHVWFVGYKPSWVHSEHYIPISKRAPSKHITTLRNLIRTCKKEEISDEFVLMNDDFFLLRDTDIPHRHSGPMKDKRLRSPYNSYAQALRQTGRVCKQWVDEPLCYNVHRPIRMIKDKVIALTDEMHGKWNGRGIQTLYGNRYQLGGERVTNAKISVMDKGLQDDYSVSTSDQSFAKGLIGEQLRERFTEPSRWE